MLVGAICLGLSCGGCGDDREPASPARGHHSNGGHADGAARADATAPTRSDEQGGGDASGVRPSDDSSRATDRTGGRSGSTDEVAGDAPTARYVDVTDEAGLDFAFQARPSSDYFLPGIMGGGGAVFDADGDGRDDLYLLNGNDGTADSALRNRLFLMGDDGRLVDGTEASGLGDRGFGMGVAVGDIDNDGDVDVYVTNYGADRLFRNEGDGTYTDVSESAGIDNDAFSASVAFLDYDRDGWLDIYVANYVHLDESKICTNEAGLPDFCGPNTHPPRADVLYRNMGDGSFADVSAETGIGAISFSGLGVVCADLDRDGWVDVFVANDGDPNLLWVNQGDGTFLDDGTISGAAYSAEGRTEAGMGVTVGDTDGDGDLDLFLTHYFQESNTLYRNDGGLAFDDATARAHLGAPSMPFTGWGTSFFDADLDGDLDLAVANGSVQRKVPPLRDGTDFWRHYAEPNQIYLNDGTGRYALQPDGAGDVGLDIAVSRGLIPFDMDGDGDLDLLVLNVEQPARLYRNDLPAAAYLDLHVVDESLHRAALGAAVEVRTSERTVAARVGPPGGYLTTAPATIHFGLAPDERVESIAVRWVGGEEEVFDSPGRGSVTLRRGQGSVSP